MTIKLDRSPSKTVVIVCSDCPYWSAIRFGMEEAHKCAVGHEKELHPESENARRAARDWLRRHAADSSNLPTPSADSQTWESVTHSE